MRYDDLVKKVQRDSGFSDLESEMALDTMVENLAERMSDDELHDFTKQLPEELKEVALSAAMFGREDRNMDMIQEFMVKEQISEERAKEQALSAWAVLRSLISEGQIQRIKDRLSPTVAQMLH